MMFEKIPAKTSSNMIPQPDGNFSLLLMGNGLTISKNRNNIKAAKKKGSVLGIAIIAVIIPAISSMIIIPGSCAELSPNFF